MILSLLNSDQHRWAFLDHLLLATKWVGVVGWVWLYPYHFKGACSGPVKDILGLEEGAVEEERRAGAGSYGYVFQVTVGGVQRIAKKLHSNFINPSVS